MLGDLALNHVLPVATRYQSHLVDHILKMKTLFAGERGEELVSQDLATVEKIAEYMSIIKNETALMVEARKKANRIESEREKAIAYHDTVVPSMDTIRVYIDKLELMVDNEMWPLPKYRELLFF